MFSKAAIRYKAQEQARLLGSVALGAQGTGKSIKETVGKLSKQADGK